MEVVAVLGASNDKERYSYKAMEMLIEFKHQPLPIHPKLDSLLGYKVYKSLDELTNSSVKVDTLTIYVNPLVSSTLKEAMIKLAPKRFIFNPGSENLKLEEELRSAGFLVERACTLVLLRTGVF